MGGTGGAGQELVTETAPGQDGVTASSSNTKASSDNIDLGVAVESRSDGDDNGGGEDGRGVPGAAGTEGSPQPAPLVDEGQPDLGEPDELVAEVREKLEATGLSGGETLAAIEPIDQGPADESFALRDGRRVNEAGELNSLDEAAALACADVERALTAIDDGVVDQAADNVASAAQRAGESTIDDVAAWSEMVETAWTEDGADTAVLLGFLSACTHGGYEL